ncbi:hypothetical protein K788_0007044 (plasmid) [Paraburkholderia caribensis MBA4]|uniref:Uncharacterized protein n=1 Tax=Paraburkholderia caribensis MBA4 TaxID=1323664 RepID=A0A0P0RSC7_9BURK|nr:hypothetical protein K788_0007044 [Paraburkholderia caribensis MBA4]
MQIRGCHVNSTWLVELAIDGMGGLERPRHGQKRRQEALMRAHMQDDHDRCRQVVRESRCEGLERVDPARGRAHGDEVSVGQMASALHEYVYKANLMPQKPCCGAAKGAREGTGVTPRGSSH